ncbi:DUF393 domain-containing protein [Akkermansiaceae bacterium]|nr:DUF393 domain-containing protein [Akkermansiaceae bacterium]
MSEEGKALVFYDGSCGFCVRSVALVKHLDVAGRLSYLSLEEGKGRGFEFEEGTMAVVREAKRCASFSGSAGGVARLGSIILLLTPLPLREWGYRLIAKNRYRLMGRVEKAKQDT